MSDMARCELCNGHFPVEQMQVFRMKDQKLIPAGREWQLKAGVRHICRECGRAVSDPFAEAREIRRGRGELPDYEVIAGWLQRVPQTWLPALVGHIVELAVIQSVFRDTEALSAFVAGAARRAGNPLRQAVEAKGR